jgi:hypothetical protein
MLKRAPPYAALANARINVASGNPNRGDDLPERSSRGPRLPRVLDVDASLRAADSTHGSPTRMGLFRSNPERSHWPFFVTRRIVTRP